MRSLALPLASAFAFALVAGCAQDTGSAPQLVPYPRLGDAVAYEATGMFVDLARWQNAQPLVGTARVELAVAAAGDVLDGARSVHAAYQVTRKVGGAEHAVLLVANAQQSIVQARYKLSQDQAVLAFDERGYPWLWGASALFGEELRLGAEIPFALPDNTAGRAPLALAWRVDERGDDGVWRLSLVGNASLEGTLLHDGASAWPLRVELAIAAPLAPHVRVESALPARIVATRASMVPGTEPVPPRDRGSTFGEDASVDREPWDGEKPPDGAAGYVPYALAEAVRDAKLVDSGLQAWLRDAQDPRVYRATHKEVAVANDTGPVAAPRAPYWLVQFVDANARYYEVQIERVAVQPLGQGVPRVTRSSPAEAPEDPNHGWFAKEAAPDEIVPLSEGVRVVREVFGATKVEIFLRSFLDPTGYSYYIDGGIVPGETGRYTVVYNPASGFIEQATGFVPSRLP